MLEESCHVNILIPGVICSLNNMYLVLGYIPVTEKINIGLSAGYDIEKRLCLEFTLLVQDKGESGLTNANVFHKAIKCHKVYCRP